MTLISTRSALGIAGLVSLAALPAFAQTSAQLTGDVQSAISVSRTTGASYNDPMYLADRSAGSNYSGVVDLLLRNSAGQVTSGCTASYLGNGKLLTAAHCVSNGTSITAPSFTARFYQTGFGWVDVNGTGVVVKAGYSSTVVNENDVAVLTLSDPVPAFARSYALATGHVLGLTDTFAGYGRYGNGNTGAIFSDQFSNDPTLRTGNQVFESTCRTGGSCATINNSSPETYGGIFISDFDRTGVSESTSFVCAGLGFCGVGLSGDREVTIGAGDSGGASFNADWTITGVASFSQIVSQTNTTGGFFSYYEGHTCVAHIDGNAGCNSNYDFVEEQLAPEPASMVLLGTGMLGVFGFARRRRA